MAAKARRRIEVGTQTTFEDETSYHKQCPLTVLLKTLTQFDGLVELYFGCKLCEFGSLYQGDQTFLQHIHSCHADFCKSDTLPDTMAPDVTDEKPETTAMEEDCVGVMQYPDELYYEPPTADVTFDDQAAEPGPSSQGSPGLYTEIKDEPSTIDSETDSMEEDEIDVPPPVTVVENTPVELEAGEIANVCGPVLIDPITGCMEQSNAVDLQEKECEKSVCDDKSDDVNEFDSIVVRLSDDAISGTGSTLTPRGVFRRLLFLHRDEKVCQICRIGFEMFSNLKDHLRVHAKLDPRQCQICDVKLDSPASRQYHEQCHMSSNNTATREILSCSDCGEEFTLKCRLEQHMFTHDTCSVFKCRACGFLCKELDSKKRHIRMHHFEQTQTNSVHDLFETVGQDGDKNAAEKDTNPEGFPCTVCNKVVQHFNLERHMLIHDNGPATNRETSHIFKSIGQDSNKNAATTEPVVCKVCNIVIKRKDHLKRHMLIHDNRPALKCLVCGYLFKRLDLVKAHIKKHHSLAVGKTSVEQLYEVSNEKIAPGRSQSNPHKPQRKTVKKLNDGIKRPRGRPRKDDVRDNVMKRPPGRPRKDDVRDNVMKRPRGRPRKNDVVSSVRYEPLQQIESIFTSSVKLEIASHSESTSD